MAKAITAEIADSIRMLLTRKPSEIDSLVVEHWLRRVCVSRILLNEHIAFVSSLKKTTSNLLTPKTLERISHKGCAQGVPLHRLCFNVVALNQIYDEVRHLPFRPWLWIIATETSLPRDLRQRILDTAPAQDRELLRVKAVRRTRADRNRGRRRKKLEE